MKRVLIVSPHFPPTNAPDHQRVRMSLPYFHEFGWEPEVLAVDARMIDGPQDPLLGATVPANVPVHRVGALPARFTRLLGIGTVGYRAWWQLAAAGGRRLGAARFDLVYFSTTQFLTTTLGPRWRKRHGVPYVVDIQDPWRTDYYERPGAPRPPGGWKYRFARWQARHLEERAWRDAAGFISVSQAYLEQLAARYAWFATRPAAVIPFGASSSDFATARSKPGLAPAFSRQAGVVHVVSVGAMGPIMRGALDQLFGAVRALMDAEPALRTRLRFEFIGTSYAPASRAELSVLPLARAHGLDAMVSEQPARVPYFVALKTMLTADALFIPGSDDAGYTPSRLAPCFLASRPTLALGPGNSSFADSVRALSFATLANAPDVSHASVHAFLRCLFAPSAPAPSTTDAADRFEAEFSARARTREQCALFGRALAARVVP